MADIASVISLARSMVIANHFRVRLLTSAATLLERRAADGDFQHRGLARREDDFVGGHIADGRGFLSLPSAPDRFASRQRGKLADVNTTSIRAAVELGCQTMGRTFNADDHDVGAPFFWISLRPVVPMQFVNRFVAELPLFSPHATQ